MCTRSRDPKCSRSAILGTRGGKKRKEKVTISMYIFLQISINVMRKIEKQSFLAVKHKNTLHFMHLIH